MRESRKSEYGNGKHEYASTSRVMNTLAERKKNASKFPVRIEVELASSVTPKTRFTCEVVEYGFESQFNKAHSCIEVELNAYPPMGVPSQRIEVDLR